MANAESLDRAVRTYAAFVAGVAPEEVIDELFAVMRKAPPVEEPAPDLSDMDRVHRRAASTTTSLMSSRGSRKTRSRWLSLSSAPRRPTRDTDLVRA